VSVTAADAIVGLRRVVADATILATLHTGLFGWSGALCAAEPTLVTFILRCHRGTPFACSLVVASIIITQLNRLIAITGRGLCIAATGQQRQDGDGQGRRITRIESIHECIPQSIDRVHQAPSPRRALPKPHLTFQAFASKLAQDFAGAR